MAWNLKQKAQDHIVSIGLGLIVLLLLVVWGAIDSSVWGKVSAATPKRALWALLGLAGITICLLSGALIDGWRKTKAAAASKPEDDLVPLYGVLWNRYADPYCPVCRVLLNFHRFPSESHLKCPKCKSSFLLHKDGWPITHKIVKELFQKVRFDKEELTQKAPGKPFSN